MKSIQVLDPSVSNKIAAGEVVERPMSVVKELVENALDAGAHQISVEIQNGGVSYIRVTDDGCGILPEEAVVAFERHATSKISVAEDLYEIETLGFRGEALSSIAAVAHVELFSKTEDSEEGIHLIIEGGKVLSKETVGCPKGTTMVVRNLFFNTPARMKFLKKDATEAAAVTELMGRLILGNAEVSFRYLNQGREVYCSTGDGNLLGAMVAVWGSDYRASMLPVTFESGGVKVEGLLGKAEKSRANRTFQNLYINGRYVKSNTVMYSVEQAFAGMLMTGRHPVYILNLTLNPSEVDVNVHPTKMEVKFSDEQKVSHAVFWAVKGALNQNLDVPEAGFKETRRVYYVEQDQKPAVQQEMEISPAPVSKEPSPAESIDEPKEDVFYRPREKTRGIRLEESYKEEQPVTRKPSAPKPTVEEEPPQKDAPEAFSMIGESGQVKPYRIAGQVFETYIIVECEKEMILIDQHAAHERLLYEKLLKDYRKKKLSGQRLMLPVPVSLTPVERETVLKNLSFFESIGFEIEPFGENGVKVKETPMSLPVEQIAPLIEELSEKLQLHEERPTDSATEAMLHQIACKAAVKAHHKLSPPEMEKLVRDVLAIPEVHTCPHGRPFMIRYSKYQLEKAFGRVI